MFKAATYLLLILTAGAIIVMVTLSIPHVVSQDQREDLQNDVLRAQRAAAVQFQLEAYQELVAAQRASSQKDMVALFTPAAPQPDESDKKKDDDDAPQPQGPQFVRPQPDVLDPIIKGQARALRQDMVVILDAQGKVLASSHEEGPKRDTDWSGLPPIKDALAGLERDWLWASGDDNVMLTAASPVVVSDGNKMMVGAVVMIGQRLDSSMANNLASKVDPLRAGDSRINIAFVHKGRRLGSSVKDAELQALISTAAGTYSSSALPSPDPEDGNARGRIRITEQDGRVAAHVTVGLQDSKEGRQTGMVILSDRALLDGSIIGLAVAAFTVETAPGQGPPVLVIAAIALVLFLLGWLIMNNEHSAPARKLAADLAKIESNIESGELNIKRHRGSMFNAAKRINSIMTGLRKRLTRERNNSKELFIPPDAIEPVEPEPVAPVQAAPAPVDPNGLPFRAHTPAGGSRSVARADTGQYDLIEKPVPKRIVLGESQDESIDDGQADPQDQAPFMPAGFDDEALLEELQPIEDDAQDDADEFVSAATMAMSVDELPFQPTPASDLAAFGAPAPQEPAEELPEDAFLPADDDELFAPEDDEQLFAPEEGADNHAYESEENAAFLEAATASDAIAALSHDIADALSGDSSNEPDSVDEDRTLDIGPEQLQGLISKNSKAPAPEPAPEPEAEPEAEADPAENLGAVALRAAVQDGPTLVDNLGVVKKLASNTRADEEDDEPEADMLAGSAISASNSANMLPRRIARPGDEETDTADVARDDQEVQSALNAPSSKPSALDPKGLLDNLKRRNIGDAASSGASTQPFPKETSQVRPFPSDPEEASKHKNPFVHQAPTTPGKAPKKKPEAIDPDQQYFEKLYKQFVDTKIQCGEPTESLTMAKFTKRLQKNKAQLMDRYQCRSVRFQVYVKNGKAALKATPIK